jgi:hypothetical protein
MMIGYNIYNRFTMEHFPLRQSMILTTNGHKLDIRHNKFMIHVLWRPKNFGRHFFVISKKSV